MLADSSSLPRLTAPIVLGFILAAAGLSAAAPAVPVARSTRAWADIAPPDEQTPLPKLNIGECLRIALEKQPKLIGMQASLRSAQASLAGQQRPSFLVQFTGDHKYRLQQAQRGVCAAEAELNQTVHDVTHAVALTYYSVVYAREQRKVARDAVEFVDFYREQVEKILNDKKGGSKDINQITLNRLVARLAEGQLLLVRAEAGFERAKAGLREAMGVEPTFLFDPADEVLPDFGKFEIKKEDVIGYARTHRGEVKMAELAVEVTRLEAYAQWAIRIRYRAETFAAGGDIHSRPLPYGNKDGEYRPSALGPEMPTSLFGQRKERTQRAWELAFRSQAVLDNTRNLVTLEAEDAYVEYASAGQGMVIAKRLSDAGNKSKSILEAADGPKVSSATSLQQMLEAQEEAAKGRAAYNEAVYKRIAALANIERITAGNIKVNYPGR